MNKIIALFIAVISFFPGDIHAQLAMGKWRTHLAYNNVGQIAQTEKKIFAVSEGSLYSIDKEDLGLEFFSKVSGLNDNNISRIEYDTNSKQLLLVYANGNIDLLSSGGVINILDLYIKQMSTSKNINDIMFNGDLAYLSMNFGILVLNMKKREIADTYFIGANASEVKVLKTVVNEGKIYAASASAIYTATANDPNIVNYEYWKTMTGLPGSGTIPVDRDGGSDVAAIRRVLQTLQSGKALILFPEGTRSLDGNLQPAKAGVGLIACKTQAPVLPARIFNSHHAFGKSGGIKPGVRVSVAFGPLIYPADYDDPAAGRERYQKASEHIMSAIARLREPHYAVI